MLKYQIHGNFRYSNTLLLTLNNRIYFCDHPPPASLGDSACLDSTCHPAASPLCFDQATPLESATISCTSARHNLTLPALEDAEKGQGDVIIIGSD